jgi:hypothetical protein
MVQWDDGQATLGLTRLFPFLPCFADMCGCLIPNIGVSLMPL